MSHEIEQTLRDGLDRMIDLVEEGMDPTDALRKVAGEEDLLPDTIRVLGTTYNNSASVVHIKSGEDVFAKASDHPLADPEVVISESFSKTARQSRKKRELDEEKDDSYYHSPSHNSRLRYEGPVSGAAAFDVSAGMGKSRRQLRLEKNASVDTPETIALPKDNSDKEQRRFAQRLAPLRKNAAAAKQKASCTREHLDRAVRKIATYFDYDSALPWGEVVEQSEVMFGKLASTVLNYVEDRFEIRKRTPPKYFRLADENQAPYSLVKEAMRNLREYDDASTEYVKTAALCSSYENSEMLQNTTPTEEDEDGFEKEAFLGGLLSGAAGGAMSGAQGMYGTPDRAKEKLSDQLDDPIHLSQLRYIKATNALNDALTDPRLKPYSRERAIDAYNQISDVAPKVAERGTLLVPYMHRILVAGGLDPFDSKALVDVEYNLKRIGTPLGRGGNQQDEGV